MYNLIFILRELIYLNISQKVNVIIKKNILYTYVICFP